MSPPPIDDHRSDDSLGLSWLRTERRQHPSIEEQIGLFRFQIEQVAKRSEENREAVKQIHGDLCKLIERINRMETHYGREEQSIKDFIETNQKEMKEVRRLLEHVRFSRWLWGGLVWVGVTIAGIVTALYHGYGLLDFFK